MILKVSSANPVLFRYTNSVAKRKDDKYGFIKYEKKWDQ